MNRLKTCLLMSALMVSTTAHAATISFNSDPFAGTNASDPGRQIVGGPGTPIIFDIGSDVFAFSSAVFGVDALQFVTAMSADLPTTGFNVVVLQDGAPLAAGVAADRIAARLTTSGPGFFIYFNTGLDLPRLVFSTDLGDNTADLAILGRLMNLGGPAGFAQLPTFTAANFAIAEPAMPLLLLTSAVGARFAARAAGALSWTDGMTRPPRSCAATPAAADVCGAEGPQSQVQ